MVGAESPYKKSNKSMANPFNSQSKTSFRITRTTSGTHATGRKNEKANIKLKEKIKEKRAAKAQKKALDSAEKEDLRRKAQKEKDDRVQQFKKKRLERTKVISKKTHRGQPLMKDRMQLLLKQIQEMKRS